MFVTLYLSLQLLDDLLASFQSHLLSLVQPAAHVFDLSLQTLLHSLQVEGVLLLQTQLLSHSCQLEELHHPLKLYSFKWVTMFYTSAAIIFHVLPVVLYLTAGLLGLVSGSSQLSLQLLMLLLQSLEIHLKLPPST